MKNNAPLRTLYVLNAAAGGATQGIIELLRQLPAEEHEAYLVIPAAPNENQQKIFSQVAKEVFIVPMTWWNSAAEMPILWRFLTWLRGAVGTLFHLLPLWKLCRIIRSRKIDIVYTNTIVVLDGALAAKLCGVPHIWHIKEWFGAKGRVQFGIPDAWLAKLISALSASVIVMTEFIGEFFSPYKMENKVRVIYDGVHPADFEKESNGLALRETLGIQPGQFVVGMAASLSSVWKEHAVFIEMAALLADEFPKMVFAAFGSEPKKHRNPAYNQPWRYYQGLQQHVRRLGLQEKFIWAGFHADIPQMMSALDVLVHPCAHEPFGRVAIEAQAAGRPVVGPNSGGIAESVVHGKTGLLVEPGNPRAFADGVRLLARDRNMLKQYGANGRAHVRQNFSNNRHAQEIARLYNLIAPKGPKVSSKL